MSKLTIFDTMRRKTLEKRRGYCSVGKRLWRRSHVCSRILLVVISNNKKFCVFDVFFWYHMSILLFIRDSNVL